MTILFGSVLPRALVAARQMRGADGFRAPGRIEAAAAALPSAGPPVAAPGCVPS